MFPAIVTFPADWKEPPAEIRKDPAVVQAYLGQSAGEMQAKAGEALGARVSGATADAEGDHHG